MRIEKKKVTIEYSIEDLSKDDLGWILTAISTYLIYHGVKKEDHPLKKMEKDIRLSLNI